MKTLLLTLLLALPLAQACESAPSEAPSKQPNIIFIMADDLGYNHLSCYGQKRLTTPHIDALAAKGIRFTDAYAGCTVCGPSRSSLMTGLHSGHIPYKVNKAIVDITDSTPTVAEMLKKAGYRNGAFGKWGIGGQGSGQTPLDRGFDTFYGMLDQGHGHRHYPSFLIKNNCKDPLPNKTAGSRGNTSSNPADRKLHTHDAFTVAALDFIGDQKRKPAQPFFCYLAFTLPHTEIIANDTTINTPEFDADKWPETYTADTASHIRQPQPRRHFGAEIRMLDNSVGAIMEKLDELSIRENTLVIFTSDNGGQLKKVWGSAPSTYFQANGILRGGKTDCYEGGLRVPMIVYWPQRSPQGTVSKLPTYFADFLPTVCDLTGQKPPQDIDGLSILPTLTGNAGNQAQHEFLFWSHQAKRLDHAVRSGPWKAVKRGNNPIELYNLDIDISEQNDVAKKHPDIASEMENIISQEYTPDLKHPGPSAKSPVYPQFNE
ncbi:N-acetylgalactosamine-6-O-sulfatase [Rubritalea halochordaticola]|uniref:N-acetylgalactosamine-6-O-sulfatase n=1 Tax=Rubritalea halochordaticola TaxID=714537 RepID=A0ABP9V386_9BACT